MSMCAGKIYCRIYREKKYCTKATADDAHKCDCRHAAAWCDIERCVFEEDCRIVRRKDREQET